MKRVTIQPFIIPLLMVFCALFYYFGELVDWAAWDALRHTFFYGIHDIHRLVFLIPILYAGYTARIKGAVIITLISFMIFLPRAFFISPYPDPLLRMVIFTVFAGFTGILVGIVRKQSDKFQKLESSMATQRNKMFGIIDAIADGIIITGPDYVIRFMNSSMANDFGDGVGIACYQHLKQEVAPCGHGCGIMDVINSREIRRWECTLTNGRTYDVLAAPYIDADGTACQISIFRAIDGRCES